MSSASLQAIISVSNLSKTFASGLQALKNIDLDIRRGEIFALLGPNGAGKTTLISTICGIVNPTSGTVLADGHDTQALARLLGIAPHTVEWHVTHVIEKLRVHSKLQAVIAAARLGLIEL